MVTKAKTDEPAASEPVVETPRTAQYDDVHYGVVADDVEPGGGVALPHNLRNAAANTSSTPN